MCHSGWTAPKHVAVKVTNRPSVYVTHRRRSVSFAGLEIRAAMDGGVIDRPVTLPGLTPKYVWKEFLVVDLCCVGVSSIFCTMQEGYKEEETAYLQSIAT